MLFRNCRHRCSIGTECRGVHGCRHCCRVTGSKDDVSRSHSQWWWCGRWERRCPRAISWDGRPFYRYQSCDNSRWCSGGAPGVRNVWKVHAIVEKTSI
ncbi:Laminin subunit beta-4, partial [Ophiophagus hannah]